MNLANQIRKALRDHPKSLYAIEKATGIPRSTLSRISSGERWVNEATLNTLADYLGIEISRR